MASDVADTTPEVPTSNPVREVARVVVLVAVSVAVCTVPLAVKLAKVAVPVKVGEAASTLSALRFVKFVFIVVLDVAPLSRAASEVIVDMFFNILD